VDADAKRFKKLQAEFNILAEQWKTTESLSERLHLLAQIKKVLDRTHKFIDDMNQQILSKSGSKKSCSLP